MTERGTVALQIHPAGNRSGVGKPARKIFRSGKAGIRGIPKRRYMRIDFRRQAVKDGA